MPDPHNRIQYSIPLTAEESAVVRNEMLNKLAVRLWMSVRSSFIGYLLQTILLYKLVPHGMLLGWVALIMASEALTGFFARKLMHAKNLRESLALACLPFSLFLSGATWGAVVILPGVTASPWIFMLNLLFLAVVAIISVNNLCYHRRCLTGFTLGLAAPLLVACVYHVQNVPPVLGLAAIALYVMLYIYSHSTYNLVFNDVIGRLGTHGMALELLQRNNELTQALERIHQLASLDPLTQCLNRRAVTERFEAEMGRYRRYGTVFGVVMLDIDNFKEINDQFGHAVGDAVLIAVTERLQAQLRPLDSFARWGGEEFICLIAHTGADGTLATAEKLRKSLCETPLLSSPQSLTVTASFGVAVCEPNQSVHDLINQADRVMYCAKQTGRNKVCAVYETPLATAK